MMLEIYLQYNNLSNISDSSALASEDFDCEDSETFYTWVGFSWLCFVTGFPATVAILWEMFKMRRRRNPFSPNDFFMLNLSIMDAIFLSFIPPGMMNLFIWMNREFDTVWDSVYAFNMCGRPFLMACSCLDCYLAVVHPVAYHKRKDLAPRVVMVGIVWILTVAIGMSFFFIPYSKYTLLSLAIFLIVVGIIGICDGFIIHALRKSGPGRNNIHPQKQRAIQTLIVSLAMVVISYLPPAILIFIQKLLSINSSSLFCLVDFLSSITSTWGSGVMPLIYLHNIRKLGFLKPGFCKF